MKIKTIITTMIAATLLMSCGNSTQTKTEQSQSTTVEVVNDTIVLPTSNIDYNFNYHEDIGNVTKKLKKTFVLKDSAKVDDWHNYIKKDYIVDHHYAFVKQNDSISVKYHIINGDEHKDWFAYLTVVISSTKPNAFDILQPIMEDLNKDFGNNPSYNWNDDRKQFTNGKQWVYISEPSRDEDSGEVFFAVCVMPIDRVNK